MANSRSDCCVMIAQVCGKLTSGEACEFACIANSRHGQFYGLTWKLDRICDSVSE